MKKVVCMHEEDHGLLWKHVEYRWHLLPGGSMLMLWTAELAGPPAAGPACLGAA